jgi:hypothetical protein
MKIQRILLWVFITLLLGLCLLSCSKESPSSPEEVEIPHGYDSSFDYLSVLKSSPEYGYESTEGYPAFTYQDSTAQNLVALRETHDLKKAAGDGDEMSKILKLLQWVHTTIRHNGQALSPDPENALNILQYCQDTGNGVNCVMMAIVLNEVYLSMGFKSRYVNGHCKTRIFDEWHAFNMVYATTLGKWLFVDPTFNAYFTDGNGNVLGIREIREHLIQDQLIILNDGADYNGLSLHETDDPDYLHYLTKNFYRFSCPVRSEFGCGYFHSSSESVRTFINLNPKNDRQGAVYGAMNCFTSNPDYFWVKP